MREMDHPTSSPIGPTPSLSLPNHPSMNLNLAAFSHPKRPLTANATSSSTSAFPPILPADLLSLIQLNPSTASSTAPSTLVLDLRPHSSYTFSHLISSINICLPSTLLRRATHTADLLSQSLSPHDQERFSFWKQAANIVVLDQDSSSLVEGGGLASLLNKFAKAGHGGRLCWVKGGFTALRNEVATTGLPYLESGAPTPQQQNTTPSSPSPSVGSTSTTTRSPRPVLKVSDLPVSAFQALSTSAFTRTGLPTSRGPLTPFHFTTTAASGSAGSENERPGMGKRRKSGEHVFSAGGSGEENRGFAMSLGMGGMKGQQRGPLGNTTPAAVPSLQVAEKRMATNPFFDNIRQNQEALSLERSLTNLTPLELPDVTPSQLAHLPNFMAQLLSISPLERAVLLARQYYDLEYAERERLEGTLFWHANVQGKKTAEEDPSNTFSKYAISAGVELGSLNRFKNIFPYDHARVRLSSYAPGATDYINASFVSLKPSRKRFIASQGPLPTTFPDFWQMVHQERVGVIIMLTNLREGGREKCSRYWSGEGSEGQHGPWVVEAETGDGGDEEEEHRHHRTGMTGGFFAQEEKNTTLRRWIELSRKDGSDTRMQGTGGEDRATSTSRRRIRHIQYRAWPDFDIPAHPSEVVGLIKEVDQAQEDYLRSIGWDSSSDEPEPPVLAHCSAGVGRTGVFIMVSSLLDLLREERKQKREQARSAAVATPAAPDSNNDMDVDSPPRSNNTTPSHFPLQPTPIRTLGDSQPSPPVARNRTPSGSSISSSTSDTSSLIATLSASTLNSSSITTPSTSIASTPIPSSTASSSSTTPLPQESTTTIKHPSCSLRAELDEPIPLLAKDPIFSGVNSMREQRMSMVATHKQYVCVFECVLYGVLEEVKQEEERERERMDVR